MSADATTGGRAPGGAPPEDGTAALREGVRLFAAGDLAGAHAAFERSHRRNANDPGAMSWYGVTLVLVEKNTSLGVLYCDQALRWAGPEPDLLLNQARVALALGQRERAVRAVGRGLELFPGHPGLEAAKAALGWRRPAVLRFLARRNPLNRWLGRLRHRLVAGPARPPPASPLTLGLRPPPEG